MLEAVHTEGSQGRGKCTYFSGLLIRVFYSCDCLSGPQQRGLSAQATKGGFPMGYLLDSESK